MTFKVPTDRNGPEAPPTTSNAMSKKLSLRQHLCIGFLGGKKSSKKDNFHESFPTIDENKLSSTAAPIVGQFNYGALNHACAGKNVRLTDSVSDANMTTRQIREHRMRSHRILNQIARVSWSTGPLRKRRRAALMLIAVVTIFFICYLPIHLLQIFR
ncbi:unnamed protein product [Protopolystoma xenopodis]|uniref:G-protein coupled receptors family 1 profile domain-containing protein n=1 Tax=Protopolystoma xenopodis TaxID=117903 RepID=A0A448WGI5_9PLAT|nr:unnamed protein product [Protopolystoma xenopodis]